LAVAKSALAIMARVAAVVLLLALAGHAAGLAAKSDSDDAARPPFPNTMPEWMDPSAGPNGKIPAAAPDYTQSKNPCYDEYTDKGCMPGCWSNFLHCVQG